MDSSDKKKMRKQLLVDPKVQGALVLRAVLYWAVCLITITLMILCWRIVTGPARLFYTHFDDMWFHFGPAVVASTLLLPLLIVDMLRLSNRFVGPLFRLRRAMRALARGEYVEPVEFRGGDFWQEIADEFNTLAARVQGTQATPPSSTPSEAEAEEPVGAAS